MAGRGVNEPTYRQRYMPAVACDPSLVGEISAGCMIAFRKALER